MDIVIPRSESPTFSWKPLEAMPKEGKFLVLNLNRRNMQTSISTVTLNEFMHEHVIADYMRDALCWDYYPNVEITNNGGSEPDPDLPSKRMATA